MSTIKSADYYDVSKFGFLPSNCVKFAPYGFEYLAPVLDALCGDDEEFRKIVDDLEDSPPEIPDISTLGPSSQKMIYSTGCLMVHKYVWGTGPDNARDTVPLCIGKPWYDAAKALNVAPVLTHAAVDLYNWSLKNSDKEFCLDNLTSNYLMTGDRSEEWFYLIMVAIEGRSGKIVNDTIDLMQAKEKGKLTRKMVNEYLTTLLENLEDINKIIQRTEEKCDPNFFFNTLRLYLAGSKSKFLPNGLKIANYDTDPIVFKGGSAAQSSLIQLYDAVLDVEHEGQSKDFLMEMRDYMPEIHRNLLEDIESVGGIKSIVSNFGGDILKKYDESVNLLVNFRKTHMRIVHTYILRFVKIVKNSESSTNVHGNKGTGGTDPHVFLSKVISDTKANRVPEDRLVTNTNVSVKLVSIGVGVSLLAAYLLQYWWRR